MHGLPTARWGFTVVESLVALTLLGIGVGGWVGTSTLAVRLAAHARQQADAAHRARTRAELLASGPCTQLGGGAGSAGQDTWTISALGNGVRLIHVDVAYHTGRPRAATYELLVVC